jgi:hypothetical protein
MTTISMAPQNFVSGWKEDNLYSVAFDMTTRMVTGLFGAIVPFEDIEHSDTNLENHYLGAISEELYNSIGESISNPVSLAFWNEDNTLKVRKILVDAGPGTYLDGKRESFVGLNNTVTLIPKCVDQNGNIWNDVTTIQVKNMGKLEVPMSINGQAASAYKGTVENGESVSFELQQQGRATVRFKILVPELSTIWLSVYPELYAYTDEALAGLTAWSAAQTA